MVLQHAEHTPLDSLMRNVTGLLVSFYDVLESESQFLSAAAKARLPKIGIKLAQSYGALAKSAFDQGQKLWKLSPKLHLAEHLMEEQAVEAGNPAWYWTNADEDLVGLMIDIAETCHANTLSYSVLFKWLWSRFCD